MYRVYAIVQRPKQDDYWLNIGAAFPHEDGKGYNIILQAHQIGEKLVTRFYEPKDKEAHADEVHRSDATERRSTVAFNLLSHRTSRMNQISEVTRGVQFISRAVRNQLQIMRDGSVTIEVPRDVSQVVGVR